MARNGDRSLFTQTNLRNSKYHIVVNVGNRRPDTVLIEAVPDTLLRTVPGTVPGLAT